MNIFYFSSDLFIEVLAVSLVSLLENNKNCREINIYIVDDGITKEKKNKLQCMVDKYSSTENIRKIIYLDAPSPNDLLKFNFKTRYQIGHSYFRMCIGTLLPNNVDRVICLDSDTLICSDLEELWNIDMHGNILAGVADCMNIKKYRRQFDMDEDDIYCNAGFYLVDLKKWRQENIEEKIINRIFKQNGNVFFFEQTLMNWSCKGRILKLSPDYNAYTLFWAFEYNNLLRWRKPKNFYTDEQVQQAKNNPVIIHYTRNFYMLSRPWVEGCDHPMTAKYLEYKELTPWKEMHKDTRSNIMKLKYKVYHMIPQAALSYIVCFLYNEVRPRMIWKNE